MKTLMKYKLTDYPGINYNPPGSLANMDTTSAIRYGIIPMHDVPVWNEESEPEYAEPACPECNGPLNEGKNSDFRCRKCKLDLESEQCYPENPDCFSYNDKDYHLRQGQDDCDIWVFKSPFFTYAQFCSPCAPGACYLRHPLDVEAIAKKDANSGDIVRIENKCYCLGKDWFDDNIAPYPVYSVETGELLE